MSESQTKRLRSRPGTISAILVIAILGCGLDLAAKEAAFQHHFTVQGVYGAGQPLQILETGLATFSLVREHNTGMAFGYLADSEQALPLLLTIRLAFLVWLLWLGWRTHPPSLSRSIALGLLTAGALGNLSDNLLTYDDKHPHAIRDFLLIAGEGWSFPAFNLADAWITIGATWFLWSIYRQRPADATHE